MSHNLSEMEFPTIKNNKKIKAVLKWNGLLKLLSDYAYQGGKIDICDHNRNGHILCLPCPYFRFFGLTNRNSQQKNQQQKQCMQTTLLGQS